jgi:cytidylate kinase
VLDALAETGESGWGGLAPATATHEPPEDQLRTLIREAIAETTARGRVVIGGHAASRAVEPSEASLRVFVTASRATRVDRVAADEQIDRERAARLIKDSDAGRADYLRRFYGVSDEVPTDYDLVINTDTLSTEAAAALIARAAE